MVENQTGRKLKCLRTDNGGEFKSEEFVKFCRERGIRREYMAPYSPKQNGIVERIPGATYSPMNIRDRFHDPYTRCYQSSHTSKIRETVATFEEVLSRNLLY